MIPGQRIAQETPCIRAALIQQRDRLQKLPGQVVWVIPLGKEKSDRSPYQPTPINAWAIHSLGGEAARLLRMVDRALTNCTPDNRRRDG